jgi:hypothetical protein
MLSNFRVYLDLPSTRAFLGSKSIIAFAKQLLPFFPPPSGANPDKTRHT